jgi:hypothetical protein
MKDEGMVVFRNVKIENNQDGFAQSQVRVVGGIFSS